MTRGRDPSDKSSEDRAFDTSAPTQPFGHQEQVAEETPPLGFRPEPEPEPEPDPDQTRTATPHEAPGPSGSGGGSAPSATPGHTWKGWTDGNFEPGQELFGGKYVVVRKLGQGGMGAVWLVRHTQLHVERVLKVIVSSIAFDPQLRARFRREARAMARFTHPNAVMVHDADARPNSPLAFIEMEYIEGQSLKEILEPDAPCPLDWTARILDQLCNVLEVAHQHGIIHRDLKPANLMLVARQPPGAEFLKVLDFGIAKILEGEGPAGDEQLTKVGHILGTPQYMSPEQVSGEPEQVDARSDIYAVGVILYELLTGRRPFEGNYFRVCNAHMHEPPPPFAARNPGAKVPAGVEKLVLRCLEKDPSRRPQSASELATEFRRLIEPRRNQNRNRRVVLRLLLAAPVLLAALAWLLRPRAEFRVAPPSLVLQAGDEAGATVSVVVPKASQLEPPQVPPGLVLVQESASPYARETHSHFKLTANLNARPGSHTLEFRANSGGGTTTLPLPITVEAPAVYLPEGAGTFEVSGSGALVRVGDRICPEQIARVFEDGLRVEFLLIEPARGGAFYVMENKVWNGLFARRPDAGNGAAHWREPREESWQGYDLRLLPSVGDASDLPTAGEGLVLVASVGDVLHFRVFDTDARLVLSFDETQLPVPAPELAELKSRLGGLWGASSLSPGDRAEVLSAVTTVCHTYWEWLPVEDVSAFEAYEFAQWLGGAGANLPTRAQWDWAAGAFEEDGSRRKGPMIADWDRDASTPQVAVGLEFPLPVGTATADRSRFGCRDVAGNGMEWTRDWGDEQTTLPAMPDAAAFQSLYLRGCSYDAASPPLFDDLRIDAALPPQRGPMVRFDTISFRVAIEVPR